MKIRIGSLGIVALMLTASSTVFADGHINVVVNPYGWGEPPPVVYESPRYYAPPPVVYYGRGRWGEHRDGHWRNHDRDRSDRDRSDRRDEGDRRHRD